ncbi:FadR/GntR family transcriptional regulator [Mycobacteroides abscessus]|uniref:FadR/GntR family transcriptional regulator n=1 Tax=Mycobacteroides abscessus TaxID=36809 RepID=UPI000C2638C7|nr:FCD domain-containing protein [Mycobacteroides abscessus]
MDIGQMPAHGRAISEDIARRLITAIAVGAYSPGERLPPERELAQQLGIARETLRQSLQQVAQLGLIEARRGRGGGTFVSSLGRTAVASDVARRTLERELPAIKELFDFRVIIEGTIARTAAQRRTAKEARAMERILKDFRAAEDMITARILDRQLHGLIAKAARNRHLVELSTQLTAQVTLGFGSEPYPQEYFDRVVHEHEELIGYVVARDAEMAGRTATEHFKITFEIMETGLKRGPL